MKSKHGFATIRLGRLLPGSLMEPDTSPDNGLTFLGGGGRDDCVAPILLGLARCRRTDFGRIREESVYEWTGRECWLLGARIAGAVVSRRLLYALVVGRTP